MQFGGEYNIDLSLEMKTPEISMPWPRIPFKNELDGKWKHSGFKDVAYQHVYGFYHKLVELMNE